RRLGLGRIERHTARERELPGRQAGPWGRWKRDQRDGGGERLAQPVKSDRHSPDGLARPGRAGLSRHAELDADCLCGVHGLMAATADRLAEERDVGSAERVRAMDRLARIAPSGTRPPARPRPVPYLLAVVLVFNLWYLRAQLSAVHDLNDGSFHAAYVRWAS